MLRDDAHSFGRFVLALTILLALPCHATTVMTVPEVCPIGGEKFSTQVVMSGTSYGTYFDGRPYGLIVAPWPLVKCPGNGFVVYKEHFSKGEIARLKPFVKSDEYSSLAKRETDYYLASRLQRHMGASAKAVAWTLLRATWEASPSQYPRYAREALPGFREICPDAAQPGEGWLQCQMISGELERRLGMFEIAAARFVRLAPLASTVPLQDGTVRTNLVRTISAQRALIRARNTGPSRLEEQRPPGR